MERKFKVVGFLHTEVINVVESVKNGNMVLPYSIDIGINFNTIEEAIDAGEKAWQDNGRKLNYRVETMDGEILVIRYATMDYTVWTLDDEDDKAVVRKLESFDYIYEYFQNW